jgi:hypothetical protein
MSSKKWMQLTAPLGGRAAKEERSRPPRTHSRTDTPQLIRSVQTAIRNRTNLRTFGNCYKS